MLVGPDPISRAEMLSAGSLLYFDLPLVLTLPPQVVTAESFALLNLIDDRSPQWKQYLAGALAAWRRQREGSREVLQILKPLDKTAVYTMWLSYPATDDALQRARAAIHSSGWSADKFVSLIGRDDAYGELIRHIFLEKYLEYNRNLDELYRYCERVFQPNVLSDFLACSYGARLFALVGEQGRISSLAITKPELIRFLADLPSPDDSKSSDGWMFHRDAIALALFNGLLSHWLDPLTASHVETIAVLRKSRRGEIDRLKGKCLAIADKIDTDKSMDALYERINQEIRYHVLPDVKQLLEAADTAFQDYVEKLLSDRVFWTGFLTTVAGVLGDQVLLSAGAAISTFASIGAGAFSQYRETRSLIRNSDYCLIYTVNQITR